MTFLKVINFAKIICDKKNTKEEEFVISKKYKTCTKMFPLK